MRRRAGGPITVRANCARCGHRPDLYDVRRVLVTLDRRVFDLVVCRTCDTSRRHKPTPLEADAMAIDATDALDSMSFAQRWGSDARRVQLTAEHFLGAEVYAAERARLVAELADLRARLAERDAGWRDPFDTFDTDDGLDL